MMMFIFFSGMSLPVTPPRFRLSASESGILNESAIDSVIPDEPVGKTLSEIGVVVFKNND